MVLGVYVGTPLVGALIADLMSCEIAVLGGSKWKLESFKGLAHMVT